MTAKELRIESAAGSSEGADPEELWGLENELGYTLRVGWSGPDNPGSYNVWCVAKRRVDETRWAWRAPVLQPAEPKPWSAYANTLAGRADTAHHLAQELRDYLRQRLPEHMVPAQFVWLDRLPLTPNGKLDRRALPDVGRAQDDLAAGYIAPGNQLEGIIAEIWSEVLGIERVGVNTNFFDLGGHSLLLVRVHSALKKSVQTSLSVIDLFLHPTVRALAEAINGNGARGENVSPHSFSRPPAGFPLNPQTVALT